MSDAIALVRALGALLAVLGILCGALWAVRRFNIVLPGAGAGRPDRRLAVIERLSLDPRRSIALLRRDGVEHLVLLAPEGHLVIESRISASAEATAVVAPDLSVQTTADQPFGFAALVDRAGSRSPLSLAALRRKFATGGAPRG
jgi:hypothetical protein